MGFMENLPIWLAAGSEPPVALKNAGYKEKDAPAPNHFNYMFNRTYKALDELQKNAIHKDDYKTVTDPVTGLAVRLNTAVSSDINLQRGLQTITSDRDKPFNLKNIIGRMLLNLLGRFGTFDSITGWSFTGASGAVTTANSLYGAYALLMTLSATSSRVSRSVSTVSGKTYVVAVSVRLGTAAGATVDVTGIGSGNTVNSATGYQTTYMRFTATAATHTVGLTVTGANGQTAYVDGFRVYEVPASEYGAVPSLNAAGFAALYPYTEGLAGVKNPYAIRWLDEAKSDIAGLLAFDTELLSPPVPATESERDVLQMGQDGQYYKTTAWRKLRLDGSYNWQFSSDGNRLGYKKVYTIISGVSAAVYATSFTSEVVPQTPGDVSDYGANKVYVNTTNGVVEFSISSATSGWGDSYTPSANEIKAYFHGWKMYDTSTSTDGSSIYNRTDNQNKAWARRTNGVDASGGYAEGTLVLPTTQAIGWTPYELLHKRPTAIAEPVPSEGAMNLVSGSNVVEVGSGLIIRETARPQFASGYYYINGNTTQSSSLLSRLRSAIKVYKDGRQNVWEELPHSDANKPGLGFNQLRIIESAYDPNSTYSVSYLPIQYYPTSSFIGMTPDNERAIISDLVRELEQITRRVSANELRKAEKETAAVLIMPTLLNGWSPVTSFINGFKKIGGTNIVLFSFGVTGGAGVVSTVLTKLPAGFRPGKTYGFTVTSRNADSSVITNSGGEVRSNGEIVFATGAAQTAFLQISGVFEAEF